MHLKSSNSKLFSLNIRSVTLILHLQDSFLHYVQYKVMQPWCVQGTSIPHHPTWTSKDITITTADDAKAVQPVTV